LFFLGSTTGCPAELEKLEKGWFFKNRLEKLEKNMHIQQLRLEKLEKGGFQAGKAGKKFLTLNVFIVL